MIGCGCGPQPPYVQVTRRQGPVTWVGLEPGGELGEQWACPECGRRYVVRRAPWARSPARSGTGSYPLRVWAPPGRFPRLRDIWGWKR